MKHYIKSYLTLTMLVASLPAIYCQTMEPLEAETIAVTGRPSRDSIILRWAPMRFHAWQLGNENGYRIERYVVARNASLLPIPEKLILHPALKPFAEDQWEDLVQDEKYGAIAAQALFGDRFEVDLRNTDPFGIVNKVRENEQRFSFALFSADMSFRVAKASGLMFTDKNVDPSERYLYRIIINAGDSLRGSLFISPDEPYQLQPPENLKGEFKNGYIQLQWNKNNNYLYTAYRVERSQDGIIFHAISDSPLITVSPSDSEDTRFHYAIDSLPITDKLYHYRVKGLTPFGDESLPSNTISGNAQPTVKQVPYISEIESPDNKSLLVRWDFPAESNIAIKGFTLERTTAPNGQFIAVPPLMLPPVTRTWSDKSPAQVNYYRIVALGPDGERHSSPVFYGQLIDSIPPASPQGLKAVVHDSGAVDLSWLPNTEGDVYGYRVYKANYSSEELAQLTKSPITQTFLTDTVDVRTLNEHAHYSVMAIDKNQNHSKLSEILKVALPDKVPPRPPVLLPVKSNGDGVTLSWMSGPSQDVSIYAVYRRAVEDSRWKCLVIIDHGRDTVYEYTDHAPPAGKLHYYTIIAIDDAGLESAPSPPVSGCKMNISPPAPVEWRKPIILREENQVMLRWEYDVQKVELFRIYKASNEKPPVLYRTVSEEIRELKDWLIPTENYTYRIMAIFTNGQKSALSAALFIDY